ncbi:MAG: hypothetical protein K0S23_1919 [Fluviicola sp.]|jgi:hypothetical protein|uniref:hypothetical protein n=1 Tax=Fluviicola sp. TaxID=1917219 RepID=UPI002604E451|nr:hypothetical protein [Fluviicola sp.]MDF3027612.1 hypothetical protein [Fluviicola sp.]
MKAKTVKYSIEEPCHEDWNQMKPEAKGRFCSSCSKTVVDFSSMSDFSIVSYLEGKKKESVCGRFRPDQMDKFYTLPKRNHSFSFDLKAVALGLALSTFSAIHVDAQVAPIDTSQVIQQEPLDGMVSMIEYYDHSDEKFVSGTILVNGKGYGMVTIELIDVAGKVLLRTSPDKEGGFKVPVDWSKSEDPHSLLISGPGLISHSLFFHEKESIKDMKITLYEEIMLKGNVISR